MPFDFSKVLYPIFWWAIILFLDKSLIFRNPRKFFGVILPVSVLYWLYFELANFYFPQWHYLGILETIAGRTVMAILSFGTVIPIVIGIIEFLNGPIETERYVKSQMSEVIKNPSLYFLFLIGIILTTVPFLSDNFILNQGIWIAPFLILLPWMKLENFSAKFSLLTGISGLASGFLWEILNFWAGGKWEYLILPDNLRIFEMPLLGYLGFIPFAFSTLAVYLAVDKFIKPRPEVIAILYLAATTSSVLFARVISNNANLFK